MKKLLYNINLYPDEKTHYSNCALLISDGVVEEIIEDYKGMINQYPSEDLKGGIAFPGFIDVHTHGGYGYDFLKNADVAVKEFSKRCVKEGCTGYLASFVAEDHDVLLKAISNYKSLDSQPMAQCFGVHLEGPFLNNKYIAVMRPGSLRNPNLNEFKELLKACDGHVTDITIAPELPNAIEVIDEAVASNVGVMLGHSDASVEDARMAIAHGAKGLTHFYNAMSPHTHRSPGLVTAGLLLEDLLCELICDGFHVQRDVITATYKAIGPERIALITDSSLIKGLPDGTYEFSSQIVNKVGIKATVASTGRIAGSVVGMDDCVRNTLKFTGCSFNEIVLMASINPSKIAQVENRKGKLLAGFDADIAVLDQDLQVVGTYIRGEKVYG